MPKQKEETKAPLDVVEYLIALLPEVEARENREGRAVKAALEGVRSAIERFPSALKQDASQPS